VTLPRSLAFRGGEANHKLDASGNGFTDRRSGISHATWYD
jgi:hypothetical protein